jgi:hypothetical protein
LTITKSYCIITNCYSYASIASSHFEINISVQEHSESFRQPVSGIYNCPYNSREIIITETGIFIYELRLAEYMKQAVSKALIMKDKGVVRC